MGAACLRCRPHTLCLLASASPLRQGPPLFELLDSIESTARDPFLPFRMPIMDRYRWVGGWVGALGLCSRIGGQG